ncbi:MAG: NAD(P)-dependent oxidoreductase [Victivallales bacterium]|nr:NAD(P)-dependent oxidoreductase [Victivallales bacterium]
MRVLLTGASGRLGRVVWERLLSDGHEVVAADCRYRTGLPGGLDVADLTEETCCYRLLEGCEALIHLGNIPSMSSHLTPQKLFRRNACANMNVFTAAKDMGVAKIAFASSIQVFAWNPYDACGTPASRLPYLPADGDIPASPGHAYGLSKQVGEDILRNLATLNPEGSYVSLRFPHLLQHDHDIQKVKRYWQRFTEFNPKSIDELSSFLVMADAAALLSAILERKLPGYRQYFPAVSKTTQASIPDILKTYFCGVPLRCEPEKMHSLIDISTVCSDTGWEPCESMKIKSALEEQM